VNIGFLIDRTLRWTSKDDEVTAFRSNMSRERYLERLKLSMSGKESHIPTNLLAQPIVPAAPSVFVTLFLTSANPSKKVSASISDTADSFMAKVFPLYAKSGRVPAGSVVDDFVLKPMQLSEYITGSHSFFQFKYVADCVSSGREIHLDIIQRSKIEVLRSRVRTQAFTVPVSDAEDCVWSQSTYDPTIRYDHREICSAAQKTWSSLDVISLWDLSNRNLRFKITGLEGFTSCGDSSVAVRVDLFEGTSSLLSQPLMTSPTSLTEGSAQVGLDWLDSKISLANLPRATILSLTVLSDTAKMTPIAWANIPLFDHKHELKQGNVTTAMWPWIENDVRSLGTRQSRPNFMPNAPQISMRFDTFSLPVVFPTEPLNVGSIRGPTAMSSDESCAVERIANAAPLEPLSNMDKAMLWRCRYLLGSQTKLLSKFVQSVPRCDFRARQEMHRLALAWTPSKDPLDALELLSATCADPVVRKYAVSRLELLSDDQLVDILLQLVQALKFEPYLDCALARFLLHRAMRSKLIGHFLFWYLKAEIHSDDCYERNGLLLEAYLRGAGPNQCDSFIKQVKLHSELVRLSSRVRECSPSGRATLLQQELTRINATCFTSPLCLPIDPFVEVTAIQVDKCRAMTSKQVPIWIVFNQADSVHSQKAVMFKAGDDLRQDMLVLQMFRIMSKMWKQQGLDLQMSPYNVLSTGNRVGFVEIVPKSTTICRVHDVRILCKFFLCVANFNQFFRSQTLSGITGALNDDLLTKWMQQKNPSRDMLTAAVERFVKSCAGYCVATYVMGIGDRHSDNVMITDEGRLVHIDFGHILGNFKEKFGIKRERVPFVFTSDMAHAMGGKDSEFYESFVSLSVKAYNILREKAHLFVNLFVMMLGSGLPELQTIDDVSYMVDMFRSDLSNADAAADFSSQINSCVDSSNTKMLWLFHSIAQRLH
jgi:hypothetical protein